MRHHVSFVGAGESAARPIVEESQQRSSAATGSPASRYQYHAECVGKLRSKGLTQACASCRAELLRIEQLYETAVRRWLIVLSRVDYGVAAWGNLSEESQQDMDAVVKMMREAAETGLVDAQVALGQIYDQGQGVPRNALAAHAWLRAAADQDDAIALTQLGIIYHFGRPPHIYPSYEAALECYRKAADQGQAEAMLNLGIIHRDGLGTPQDFRQALVWFREAAERGVADAEFNLGRMFATGRGTSQDLHAAVRLYNTAADKGHVNAMFNLGAMYRDGRGVPHSQRTAMWWFGVAADKGDQRAKKIMDEFSAKKEEHYGAQRRRERERLGLS